MKNVLMVFIGGGIGASLRYLCNYFFMASLSYWVTFTINILGSFLIGLLSTLLLHYTNIPSEMKLLITTGILGGFTTFSTFQLELLTLLQEANYIDALVYGSLSLVVGLVATALGVVLAYNLVK